MGNINNLSQKLIVIYLEDSIKDTELITELIIDSGYSLEIDFASDRRTFESLLTKRHYDIILSDFKLPGFDAFGSLEISKRICPLVPFICVSGSIGEETAIELLKLGAVDYVLKDRPERLPFAIKRALEDAKDKSALKTTEELLRINEEKYRTLFENHPQPMWIYDLETLAFLEVNLAAINHYGYSKEQFLSMTLKDIRPQEDVSLLIDDINTNDATYNPGSDWRHKKKNGEIIYVEITSHLISYNNRKARHVLAQDITKRKKTEEALKNSEDKYRTIFENVQDVFYQTDMNGIIREISPSIKHFSDFQRADIINTQVADLYSNPDDRIILLDYLLAKGEVRDYEIKLKAKNGIIKNASINARLILDVSGKPNHIDGSIRDITERKKAEEALIESEDKMRMLVEGTPHLFFYTLDTDANITYISPSVEVITGHSTQEWIGQRHWFISDSDINLLAKERTRAHLRGELTEGSILLEILHANGNKVFLEIYESPIIKNNTVVGLQGVAHDITERTNSQKQIRLLSRSIEQSPVSILITDCNGIIEYVNPKFLETTGFSASEILGKNPSILKSGEQSEEFYENLWDTILKGNNWHGELHNKRKNGELFWEDVIISPIHNLQGKITHFIAIKEDITEKKKMLVELINAKDRAEEMSRLKSNLMANMSHELRTPLVGILGISEFMMEELEDECKENANIINISGKRLLKTISEILDISKLEAEKIVVNYSVINLFQLLQDEINLYSKAAALRNISIINQCINEYLFINSDERLLREIFDNLINNAVKFTNEGTISVSCKITPDEVVISISDSGIGIPSDKLEYIFEEFRQVSEGLSRNFEGTGLGLTIVKKFVMLLNGRVEVKSEINVGSTFIVTLPIKNDSQLSMTNPNINLNVHNENVDLPQELTILLVEDDPINNDVIQLMLRNAHKVVSVVNANDAIQLAKKQLFDVILMDINLKTGKNGIEATQLIRKISGYETKPIVAMTAYASDSDREEFLNSGCSHYISKPFTQKDILKLLEEIAQTLD